MRKTTPVVAGSPAPSVGSDAVETRTTQNNDTAAGNGAEKTPPGPRYSWNDDPEKTHLLLDLVTDAFLRKPADRRYIRTSEWEVLFQAYNREASAPVESIKILHNRLAILRHQCKDYHEVLKAQRRGELETDDDWREFAKDRSVVRKWQKTPFEFYDEMVACMRAQGEYLDAIDGDAEETEGGEDVNSRKRRRGEPQMRDVRRRATAKEGVKPDAAVKSEAVAVKVSLFPAALRHLKRLQLALEERVDAKRFLVDEANAQAFIHMDEEEQLFFLDKYCFHAAAAAPAGHQEL